MAAAPDDDARRTLAELEAKLRELERELLRGHGPEAEPAPAAAIDGEPQAPAAPAPGLDTPPPPAAAPASGLDTPPPPAAAPAPGLDTPLAAALDGESQPPAPASAPDAEPQPVIDLTALDDAHDLLANLRATIEDLDVTAARITTEARAVIDDHGRSLGRLERAGEAAARAEQAAIEAGRLASTVAVEAGPFADAAAVRALRDALAAQPGARDAYIRGVEDGRAVIEVHLAPPPA